MAEQRAFTAPYGTALKTAEEKRRRRFIRKAKQAKGTWFFQYFRCLKSAHYQKEPLSKGAGVIIWLILGGMTVAGSGCIVLYTGKKQVFETEANLDSIVFDWEQNGRKQEASAGSVREDSWEQEFFGIHIRFQEGQITVFREKEQIIREEDVEEDGNIH